MHRHWNEIGLFELSEQKLVGQARVIKTNGWLSEIEIEELKRETEREGSEHVENISEQIDNESFLAVVEEQPIVDQIIREETNHAQENQVVSHEAIINRMLEHGMTEEDIEIFKMIDNKLRSGDLDKPSNLRFINKKRLKSVASKVNKVVPYLTIETLFQYNEVIKAFAHAVSDLLGIKKRTKEQAKNHGDVNT